MLISAHVCHFLARWNTKKWPNSWLALLITITIQPRNKQYQAPLQTSGKSLALTGDARAKSCRSIGREARIPGRRMDGADHFPVLRLPILLNALAQDASVRRHSTLLESFIMPRSIHVPFLKVLETWIKGRRKAERRGNKSKKGHNDEEFLSREAELNSFNQATIRRSSLIR